MKRNDANVQFNDFNIIENDVITKVTSTDREIRIITDKHDILFYHEQDCCEDVYIDLMSPLETLNGRIISCEIVELKEKDNGYGTSTSSWVKIVTTEGYFTAIWRGESNGYYSESIDFIISPRTSDECTM